MPSLEEAQAYVQQLDLGYLIDFMCGEQYPLPRWLRSEAEHCCQLYKNFLLLNLKFLSSHLVPTREIDEFWHNHILYTRNYVRDCMAIFGHYFHHEPTDPAENPDVLIKNYSRTKELYLAEFSEPLELIYQK